MSVQLDPTYREKAVGTLDTAEVDVLVIGGGVTGAGCRARRRVARPVGHPGRGT